MATRRAHLGRSAAVLLAAPAGAAPVQPAPGAFRAIAKVDKRFQSYNVEMAEVTGGRF